MKKVKTYWARVYMAGDYQIAKQVCREYCMVGLCVNISKSDYIYTMGEESGFVVEIINYPRFPDTPENIRDKAKNLAERLMESCCQGSYTIEFPDQTFFYSRRKND